MPAVPMFVPAAEIALTNMHNGSYRERGKESNDTGFVQSVRPVLATTNETIDRLSTWTWQAKHEHIDECWRYA